MKKIRVYVGLAIFLAFSAWYGAYIYFLNSHEWYSAEQTIRKSEIITDRVGNIQEISVSLWGFSYRFSGEWSRAEMSTKVSGEKKSSDFYIEIEKNKKGEWVIKKVIERK